MVTTIISKVGVSKTGGEGSPNYEYTTLAAWELNRRGDITTAGRDTIEVAEIYGGGSVGAVTLNSANWTVDATHYVHIRAAAGESHGGTFNVNKAYILGNVHAIIINIGVNYTRIGPGISITVNNSGTGVFLGYNNFCIIDGILMRSYQSSGGTGIYGLNCGTGSIIRNCCIHPGSDGTNCYKGVYIFRDGGNHSLLVANCTIYAHYSFSLFCRYVPSACTLVSQNCYLTTTTTGTCYANSISDPGTFSKGTNDATSNTEAVTASLQNIAYTTANFVNVTVGSQNLHLTATSALRSKGIVLADVATDFEGGNRTGLIYDIGADQGSNVPMCWNYTAQYKNSSKLYKASGCGSFPKNIRVPNNVDKSSGKMIDDGMLIDPKRYSIG